MILGISVKSFGSLRCKARFNFTVYNILPPLFEITGAALPLVGCSDLLPSLLQNWLKKVQTLAQIPNLIVNFWTLNLRRLSMKLEKLIVFMRYRSKITILYRIYLSQIPMRAYSTLTDAVLQSNDFQPSQPAVSSRSGRLRLIPYVLYTFGHINYGSWRPKEDYFLSSLSSSLS